MNNIKVNKMLSRLMLGLLKKQLVLPGLVNTDYNEDWAGYEKGNTIRIAKQGSFVATDFVDEITIQSINETETNLVLNIHKDVSFKLSSKEKRLDTPREKSTFMNRFIIPAVDALLEAMETEIVNTFKTVPLFIEGLSTTPGSLGEVAKISKQLDVLGWKKAGRRLIVSSMDEAEMINNIEQLQDASKSSGLALEAVIESNVGRIAGLDVFSSPYIPFDLTFGNETATMTVDANVTAAESTTVSLSGATAGKTLREWDILYFPESGAFASVVVSNIEDTELTGTNDVVHIANLTKDVLAGDSCIKVGKTGSLTAGGLGGQAANVVMMREAIGMAFVNLDDVEEGEGAITQFYVDPETNIPIRIAYGYDLSKKSHIFSVDFLGGVKVVDLRRIRRVNGLQAPTA